MPGWRREELADAAGVGVTWITWLEQGRDVVGLAPSAASFGGGTATGMPPSGIALDLAGRRDPGSLRSPDVLPA